MQGLDLIMYKDGLKAGRTAGRKAGMQAGMKAGMKAGKLAGIIELFKNNVITISQAISALNVSESEFNKLLKKY